MTFPYGIPKRAMKRRLKKKGVTQAAVAKMAKVDRSTVTHWLGGRLVSKNIEQVVQALLESSR